MGIRIQTVLRTSKPMQIIGLPIWVAPWGQLDEPHAAQCHHKVPIIQPIVPKQQHRTSSQKHSPTTDLLNAIFCGKNHVFQSFDAKANTKTPWKNWYFRKKGVVLSLLYHDSIIDSPLQSISNIIWIAWICWAPPRCSWPWVQQFLDLQPCRKGTVFLPQPRGFHKHTVDGWNPAN